MGVLLIIAAAGVGAFVLASRAADERTGASPEGAKKKKAPTTDARFLKVRRDALRHPGRVGETGIIQGKAAEIIDEECSRVLTEQGVAADNHELICGGLRSIVGGDQEAMRALLKDAARKGATYGCGTIGVPPSACEGTLAQIMEWTGVLSSCADKGKIYTTVSVNAGGTKHVLLTIPVANLGYDKASPFGPKFGAKCIAPQELHVAIQEGRQKKALKGLIAAVKDSSHRDYVTVLRDGRVQRAKDGKIYDK